MRRPFEMVVTLPTDERTEGVPVVVVGRLLAVALLSHQHQALQLGLSIDAHKGTLNPDSGAVTQQTKCQKRVTICLSLIYQ